MKKALSILLALVLLAASVFIAFAEEASFTINLFDQYGDTWNGAALNVEKIKTAHPSVCSPFLSANTDQKKQALKLPMRKTMPMFSAGRRVIMTTSAHLQ